MSNAVQSIATINSFIRTLITLAVLGALGAGGVMGYRKYYEKDIAAQAKEEQLEKARQQAEHVQRELTAAQEELKNKNQAISDLQANLTEKVKEVERLGAALRLVTKDRRMAVVTVRDVQTDEKSGETFTTVEFAELDENGEPYNTPKVYTLRGDQIYVDLWLVKFKDEYIKKADLLRGTTLVLFKSIWGDDDGPNGGQPLEDEGLRPEAYAQGAPLSEFEKNLWNDIWEIANDPQKAEELGIRAIHGQANHTKAMKGKSYIFQLRASDGVSILPAQEAKPRIAKPAA